MRFDPFVLPFTIGMLVMLGILTWKFVSWFQRLELYQRLMAKKNLFSIRTLKGIREIILESLLHRRIFRKNALLGYMHMSLAFGWFLLIVVGHFETSAYMGTSLNAPYVPIFLRFFQTSPDYSFTEKIYWLAMDAILLLVLSGVALAWFKRLRSKAFGMKSTARHPLGDRIALSVLWFIFPLRLVAESITSAYYGGGSFLTGTLGNFLPDVAVQQPVFLASWWAYSLSLGIFFLALPFSRYMHIPSELGVIMLRNWGINASIHSRCGMTEFQIHACSSCGICLDKCQLGTTLNYKAIQSPYIYRSIRNQDVCSENLFNCLMCGRCEQACVVGIETNTIRRSERKNITRQLCSDLEYLPKPQLPASARAEVLYFAGCMSHLTPGIKQSMQQIFSTAGISYANLDENESICCGRPMMLAGMKEQAETLIRRNKAIIKQTGAKTLVTSCPICYKIFREEYKLNIEVIHHTQYLERLISSGKLAFEKTSRKVVYHDPCELGRGSGIYEEPRKVIRKIAVLIEKKDIREEALCCGGSLANTVLTSKEQKQLAAGAIEKLVTPHTEAIITSCPLCKKTFSKANSIYEVMDIAELLAGQLSQRAVRKHKRTKKEIFQEITF
jgi:Fe-S oxidoreductase